MFICTAKPVLNINLCQAMINVTNHVIKRFMRSILKLLRGSSKENKCGMYNNMTVNVSIEAS